MIREICATPTNFEFTLLIKQAEASIALTRERRTALISAAVTGKIDVREWRAKEG